LGEKVRLRRWLALVVRFIGVLLIVRPGSATFNLGSIFILVSVLFYALTVILTRKLQTNDSSATMAYYSSLVYLVAPFEYVLLPINIGFSHLAGNPHVDDLGRRFFYVVQWAVYFVSRAKGNTGTGQYKGLMKENKWEKTWNTLD
jgi:drug/metabolite transporter (DMT)-like permease